MAYNQSDDEFEKVYHNKNETISLSRTRNEDESSLIIKCTFIDLNKHNNASNYELNMVFSEDGIMHYIYDHEDIISNYQDRGIIPYQYKNNSARTILKTSPLKRVEEVLNEYVKENSDLIKDIISSADQFFDSLNEHKNKLDHVVYGYMRQFANMNTFFFSTTVMETVKKFAGTSAFSDAQEEGQNTCITPFI